MTTSHDNHAANVVHLLEVGHLALHRCELRLGGPFERDVLVDQQGVGVCGHHVVDGAFRYCTHTHAHRSVLQVNQYCRYNMMVPSDTAHTHTHTHTHTHKHQSCR